MLTAVVINCVKIHDNPSRPVSFANIIGTQ